MKKTRYVILCKKGFYEGNDSYGSSVYNGNLYQAYRFKYRGNAELQSESLEDVIDIEKILINEHRTFRGSIWSDI